MVLVFFGIYEAGFFEVIGVDFDFEFFEFMVLLDDLGVD
jgi:hypothetical protein